MIATINQVVGGLELEPLVECSGSDLGRERVGGDDLRGLLRPKVQECVRSPVPADVSVEPGVERRLQQREVRDEVRFSCTVGSDHHIEGPEREVGFTDRLETRDAGSFDSQRLSGHAATPDQAHATAMFLRRSRPIGTSPIVTARQVRPSQSPQAV